MNELKISICNTFETNFRALIFLELKKKFRATCLDVKHFLLFTFDLITKCIFPVLLFPKPGQIELVMVYFVWNSKSI